MEDKSLDIYTMKLGEIIKENMMDGMLEHPIKIVARGVTLQDNNGVQMDCTLKHKDFIEEENDDIFESEDEEWKKHL